MFVLCVLVLKGKSTNPVKSDVAGAFLVAAVLFACINVDMFDGPCFNPAVGVSQTIYQYSQLKDTVSDSTFLSEYMWAYTLGPAIGGLVAGVLYLIHEKQVAKMSSGKDVFD